MKTIEGQVLPEDIKDANRLIVWGDYCAAQMKYCLSIFNLEGVRHWNLEFQRVANDLKHLQFKKIDSERIGFDVKI